MTEEEKLQKAYFVLGLEPGSPLDKVIRRHKRLIMVWHPDRFPTDEGKKDAEEELKQINNAKDDLKSHFEKSHKPTGSCSCKPSATGSSQSSNQSNNRSTERPGPGPGKRKTTQETNREDAEAQRRSREREQQAAQEAADKERQRQAAYTAHAEKTSAEQAAEQLKRWEDERLRWKVTACIAVAWIGLSIFGWAGTSLKSWWHDFSWKWERDHSPHVDPPPSTGSSTGTGYVPPYEVAPGTTSTTNTSPFGPVGPRPDQTSSPYSTLDSLTRENANKPISTPDTSTPTTPDASTTTTPNFETSPNIWQKNSSTPGLQQSSPGIFQQNNNSSTLRQRASDFLNSGNSRSGASPYLFPRATPTTLSPLDQTKTGQ